ncbi:MAG: PaaI family thioesterase [Xanthomonadales bacterium]|nr:hypothetical protein [Xanthomonadales bacterium]MCC6594514.1 PaaI family thioesterase [Xanthomonadales bacterium]MCE7929777.1 PaaI family thioesterase [Xanthomonadales bacterium PRO6]
MSSSSAREPRPRLKLADRQLGHSSHIGPCYEIRLEHGMRRALLLDVRHLNPQGVVAGGALASFGEFVLERGLRDEVGEEPVYASIELSCQFLAAAFANRWIYGEAHVLRRTRELVFAAGEIFDAQRRIAFISGIWKRLAEGV